MISILNQPNKAKNSQHHRLGVIDEENGKAVSIRDIEKECMRYKAGERRRRRRERERERSRETKREKEYESD